MNTKLSSLAFAAFAVIVGLAQVGCETAQSSTAQSAVVCNGCKTVWVQHARKGTAGGGDAKGPFMAMTKAGHMKCPDCETRLEAYFKGQSKSTHVCKTCGGAMFHCTTH